MLAETLIRVAELDGAELAQPLVICNAAHADNALKALDEAQAPNGVALLEPEGRNTAAAAALACRAAVEIDPNALVLLLPADHHILQPDAFRAAISEALPLAEEGRLVTFGITPDGPETGYGYIQSGDALSAGYKIARFVEKPDLATAQSYLDEGGYFWNAGIFLLNARSFLEELEQHRPDIAQPIAKAYSDGALNGRLRTVDLEAWEAVESESVDYAVAEKTPNGAVVPVDMGWSDVGAWSALYDIADKDADGNVIAGDAELAGVRNSYLRSDSGRLVALVGVEDLIVVDTDDALLVARRDKSQDVKRIVDALKRRADGEDLL